MRLGANFAMVELRIVLAMLLPRFRLGLLAGARVDRYGFASLTPRDGLPMAINRQDREFSRGVGGVRGSAREMVELPHFDRGAQAATV